MAAPPLKTGVQRCLAVGDGFMATVCPPAIGVSGLVSGLVSGPIQTWNQPLI
jgi:hypothetical protein